MPQPKKHDYKPSGLARRLATLRTQAGWTPAQLASRIPDESITAAVIQNIESGRKSDPPVFQLMRIASALQVSILELLLDPSDPWGPVGVEGLAHPFDSMTAAEYLVATNTHRDRSRVLNGATRFIEELTDAELLLDRYEFLAAYREPFEELEKRITTESGLVITVRRSEVLAGESHLRSIALSFIKAVEPLVQLREDLDKGDFESDPIPETVRGRIAKVERRAAELAALFAVIHLPHNP